MHATFIHTADWQIGKPFAGVEDEQKRALLQHERVAVVHRIAAHVETTGAKFVLIAGDLFDSATPTKATVSAACSALGQLPVPVYAIPGNHDHGGPGSVWQQEFFQREQAHLAPNFHILLKPEPVELEDAVIFPCPLMRRHETKDPLAWLQQLGDFAQYSGKAHIVLAHGSTTDFRAGSGGDDEESDGEAVNVINLGRLREEEFDYVALGDWHGMKQITPKAWYAGTPEPDRFAKGEDHRAGHVLLVRAGRGEAPEIKPIATAGMTWQERFFAFSADDDLARLGAEVDAAIAGRANQALLRLHLSGALGIEASARLEQHLESWRARVIRLKLHNQTAIAPTAAELARLTERTADPLISRVAARLSATAAAVGDATEAAAAQVALRELYLACSVQ